ncbi:MAG: 16S rRNA (cytosine(967)-C(5))-methyltransferase RsmB, partial [Chloroflexia bacterium]|nr:16S rRNA (cytosine(967)-C(5))-methyltransferase RsmB [Chloroflexia bacterium]
VEYSHPELLIAQLQQHYPDDWQSILHQNNQPAALCLRVNRRRQTRDGFLAGLQQRGIDAQAHPLSSDAISLAQSLDITQLPGFAEGDFSVQDVAAQQAALILQPQAGQRLLDACAAPGGKTTHLLEYCDNQAALLALEKDAARLSRLQENLTRLHLNADCRVADAADTPSWWDGKPFDHILLDAPCSATGIIRRHPDIKHHRRAEDIDALVASQARLLDQLWPTLKPGGTLLYATCSILPQENTQQIAAFLQRQPQAEHLLLAQPKPLSRYGWQILPGEQGMDGFFYAHLRKRV